MELALEACRNGMAIRAAAKEFKVSKSTLHQKFKHPKKYVRSKGEARRKFTKPQESYLVDLSVKAARVGIPLTSNLIKTLVTRFLAKKGTKPVFSYCWRNRFLQRHPEISIHGKERSISTNWAKKHSENWPKILTTLRANKYLHDPSGIYYLDESSFALGGSAEEGTGNGSPCENGTQSHSVTLLVCGNAEGKVLRPLVVFEGSSDQRRIDTIDNNCFVGINKSGTVNNEAFNYYVQHELLPSMMSEKNVIFLDTESAHYRNLEFLAMCLESDKDITVVCFPADITGEMQPIDMKIFEPVSKYWQVYGSSINSVDVNEAVTKQMFARYLMEKWSEFSIADGLKSGFAASGLYPFDPAVIGQYSSSISAVVDMPQEVSEVPASEPQCSPTREIPREAAVRSSRLRKNPAFPDKMAKIEKALSDLPTLSALDVKELMAMIVTRSNACRHNVAP